MTVRKAVIKHFRYFIAIVSLLFLLDIDECLEEIDQCEHNCNNTNGSYTCSCNPGFVKDVDQRSCHGKLCKINIKTIQGISYCMVVKL